MRKLESIGRLSADDEAALNRLPLQIVWIEDGEDIVREGDRPDKCCLILTGLVCRYKLLPGGKRQILSFHTPGDIPDVQSLLLHRMDHAICALARSKVAFIAHPPLHELLTQRPGIAALFWRDTLIDAAIFREWMVGLGRRTAHERIAHLLCEMKLRFEAVGLSREDSYVMPVTQAELADALGLTMVHVNRVLRSLREDQLVRVDREGVSIMDWERLTALAEFDPSYLHHNKDWTP